MLAAYYDDAFTHDLRVACLIGIAVGLFVIGVAFGRAFYLDRTRPGWRRSKRLR